jgi:hypothetical protein
VSLVDAVAILLGILMFVILLAIVQGVGKI